MQNIIGNLGIEYTLFSPIYVSFPCKHILVSDLGPALTLLISLVFITLSLLALGI